jgi:hypothetical protein
LRQAKKYISLSNLYVFLGDSYAATGKDRFAEDNYLKAIYISPSHFYPKYQLIKLYKKQHMPDKERAWIDNTLRMPVKIASPLVDSILRYARDESRSLGMTP